MHEVKSSAIRALGHDPAKKTLRIEFQSGAVYDYADVDEAAYRLFLESDSHGRHFHKHYKTRKSRKVS